MMALEQRIEQTVSFCVGLSSGVDHGFLLEKLSHAEASKLRLEAQVLSLQHRLLELDHRLSKSKEEASMNAAAVRRQVVENVKLLEQLKQAKERCAWLEEECSLYLNDREVFRAVAEEAEDRTSQAEARALEVENKLLSEIDRLQCMELEHTAEVKQLTLRAEQLESENLCLKEKLSTAAEDTRECESSRGQCCKHSADNTCCNPILHDSTSACEAVDEDGVETLRYGDDNKSTQQRIRSAESCSLDGQLMAEVQRLWREVALFKCKLAKAEIQIQILTDDNKELRAALRNAAEKTATNHHHQHSNTTTNNKNKIQRKSVADYLHLVKSDSSGVETPSRHRQPLAPLLHHANYLR